MNVAIVHYHLHPGGVTRVIEAASQALGVAGIRHVVLTEANVEGLGYLTRIDGLTAEKLLKNLLAAATEALGVVPDIWHFHNHSLGKNHLLPTVLMLLAKGGERIVLQLHDLAEQGRPTNYAGLADNPEIYPFAPRICYAFLNSRDLEIFTSAGLPPENALLLPNPISLPDAFPNRAVNPLLFAPIRGIRRKNLGEMVLLAALAPAGTHFAVSRAPLNPEALPVHDTWQKFARKHRLPIEFDVVDRYSPAAGAPAGFESWLAHSSHFVTTSVSEGFGLPLLEAAAYGRPLLGRNLSHITAEHGRHGICAGDLYDRILIPLDWIELPILRDYLLTDLERNFRAYRRPLTLETTAATQAALLHDGWLDFGNLPESLQQGVIERLAETANRQIPRIQQGGRTESLETWLATAVAQRNPTVTREQLAVYSPEAYQKKITTLYSHLIHQPYGPIRHLAAGEILSAHLTPQSFHFLLSALPTPTPTLKFRAVIFDIYGTLLDAPPGGVKPDPFTDPILREILREFGHVPPLSPSTELHAAVLRHHAASVAAFPEIDLRILWREILSLEIGTDTAPLVEALEAAWHPAIQMDSLAGTIQRLARSGMSLGLLSNAQCNALTSLGGLKDFFAPELTLLSYQHGIAKPSPELFQIMADRLAGRGISPAETLYIGNDPLHDILPAAAVGFRTGLFIASADSPTHAGCTSDLVITGWNGFLLPV
jgi:FMN phosphatase YigB (HAD superfamily)/glycosyltransferase involved in cell wall biosynthesis